MPGLCLEDRDTPGIQLARDREQSPSASPLWESMRASSPAGTRGTGVCQQVGEESAVTRVSLCSDQWSRVHCPLGVLFTPWIYPELPADEAWPHGAPQPWSACQLRQVPKRDSTLKTVCCHRPASCPRMSPVEVHKAGNSWPSCVCAGWSVTKHVCLCMYIHMDTCLCCQAECKAAAFSLSGDTHLKASAQLLLSKKRKNVGPSLRLLVLSNLAEPVSRFESYLGMGLPMSVVT